MSTQLPKISHWTIDKSQLGLVPSDSYKLAMPIEGTTGRMTTRKITNQAELLKEYSDTSEISPNLSTSILHALKLLQFMPVYTSRVGSTNVLPGRSDKPGADGNYTVFTDSEYSPYYKSSKFKLSHEKLDSIEIDGTSISVDKGKDLDIKNAVETLNNAYSVEDNGKLVSFINVGSKISSFKVDKIDVDKNSDWTENDLTDKFISLSAGGGAFEGINSPSKFYVDVNGLNFKSMIPQNQQYPGTPVGLKFYSRHGNSPNQAYILNSWDNTSRLEYRAFPIYINDYLKSNGLNKPLLIIGNNITVTLSNIDKVEVIGDSLNELVEVIDDNKVSIGKYSSYTPVDCGFKLTIGSKSYYIGVGNLVDLDNGENLVNDSNYYKLGESEFSTVDKLLYRLYEVIRYSTIENSWLGIDGSTTKIEFNRDYLFLKSQLESYSPKVDSESSSESDIDIRFSDYDVVVYSYSLGNTKYQLSNLAYSDQYITIKRTLGENSTNYTFYCGEYPYDTVPGDEYIRISAASLTYNDFISLLISALKTKFNATYSDNGFSLFTKDVNEKWELIVPSESDLFDEAGKTSTGSIVNYTDVINNAALIVVSTGINSSNILKFTLVKDTIDPELYHLTLTRKNDEESYVISFIEDKVDGYGVLRYLDYVNDDDTGSKYFRLVRINKDIHNLPKDKVESPMFGSEVKSCTSSTTDWQVAINRFREKTGDYYDFIFDAGQVNVSVANAIYNTGVDLYANALITLPDDKSIDNLIIYRNSLGFDHRQVVMRAPRVPDTTLGNFVVYMSPITQYLERLILNKSAGKEFAPLFGITNGSVSLAPKYRYDSEEDRQRLCDAQIAPLVWDRGRQLPYFLLDLTGQRQDSNMSDVNNVRMDNLIAHLSDEIAEKYISRFNDPETRSEFVGELDIAIQQRLISHQQYRINAYKIICDETNNPDEIVEQRQFVVDIYEQYRPGIRWVKIYQGIYKLSQQI